MRQLTNPAEVADLLAVPPPAACIPGGLPSDIAPPEAVLWLAPLTIGDVITLYAEAMLELGRSYTDLAGLVQVLVAGLLVDGEDWTRTEPGALERFLPSREAAEAFGDPTMMGTAAFNLHFAILRANGFAAIPSADTPATTLAEARARLKGRGRWLPGLFHADLEAAVWVTSYTEGMRAEASTEARAELLDGTVLSNNACTIAGLVRRTVRTGPAGRELLSAALVKQLPWGAARAAENLAVALTYGGGTAWPEVQFQTGTPAASNGKGGGGGADLVRGGEAAPAAARADGDAEGA